MFRILASVLLLCAALHAQLPATTAASPVNPVIEWNRTLLVIVRTSGAQPATIHSTRSFAMLHAAVFDAVNNISRTYSPYLFRLANVSPNASQTAAADQAAHDVLFALYPTFQATLDAQLQQDLARLPDNKAKADGIAVGQTIAADLVAFRANDGASATQPGFATRKTPGFYQLTPPDFTPADFTQWPAVTPFAITNANEFMPVPPPALTSPEYVHSLAEVERIGEFDSKARTPEQSLIGLFWSGKIQNYWNEIAQTAALSRNLDIPQTAHLFALLNISMADVTIAFFDAKYVYHFWRPVTAIEASADRAWLPLTTKTAPDPSYPGAHSATSAAGAGVLQFVFGDKFTFDVTSEVLSGVTRHFTSFSGTAEEAGLSRIYAGQHFRFDHNAGLRQGQQVSQSVTQTILLPQ
jgi:hypothetical protein